MALPVIGTQWLKTRTKTIPALSVTGVAQN